MFTLNRIALVPAPDGIDLFTQKNGDFGAISVTERLCAAPISEVESHLSDRFCATLRCNVNRYLDRSGSK